MNPTTPRPHRAGEHPLQEEKIVKTTANTHKNEFARNFYERLICGRLLTDEKGGFFAVSMDGERPAMMIKKSEYNDPTKQIENLRVDAAEIYALLREKRDGDIFHFSGGDYRRFRLREWNTGCAWEVTIYMPAEEAESLCLSLEEFFAKHALLPGVMHVVFSGARLVGDGRPSYGGYDIVPYEKKRIDAESARRGIELLLEE